MGAADTGLERRDGGRKSWRKRREAGEEEGGSQTTLGSGCLLLGVRGKGGCGIEGWDSWGLSLQPYSAMQAQRAGGPALTNKSFCLVFRSFSSEGHVISSHASAGILTPTV